MKRIKKQREHVVKIITRKMQKQRNESLEKLMKQTLSLKKQR